MDGFERLFETNYLAHFALRLLLLLRTRRARVVQISSIARRSGKIRPDDLHYERGYEPFVVYINKRSGIDRVIYDVTCRPSGTIEGA